MIHPSFINYEDAYLAKNRENARSSDSVPSSSPGIESSLVQTPQRWKSSTVLTHITYLEHSTWQ
jgi:hypothetical protein